MPTKKKIKDSKRVAAGKKAYTTWSDRQRVIRGMKKAGKTDIEINAYLKKCKFTSLKPYERRKNGGRKK